MMENRVHIHETASCQPRGSAGGHFDSDNFVLMTSVSSSRSNSVELAKTELTGTSHIFLSPVFPTISIQSGTFYLNDDEFVKTENGQSCDLGGTLSNNRSGPVDTRDFADGSHDVAAVITFFPANKPLFHQNLLSIMIHQVLAMVQKT